MPAKSHRSVKDNQIICSHCKLVVNEEEEDSIECDKCRKNYHVLCTKLDKRTYTHLLKNPKEEYVCHHCQNTESSGTIESELAIIKTELKKLDQLSVLQETMNFMSKQYDDILKTVAENKKQINAIQKENKNLKTEIKTLKESVKQLNDQRVKNDCLVIGMQITENMSAVDAIIKLSNETGVEINKEHINEAYAFKKRNVSGNKQTVVVKCNSQATKAKLMSMKKKLRENEETKSVYINDFLSKETLSLLNYAQTLKKIGYRAVYSVGERIFVKRSEMSKPRWMRNEEAVDELLLEAATHKQHTTRGPDYATAEEDSE